jgi:hypothetical protein
MIAQFQGVYITQLPRKEGQKGDFRLLKLFKED